MRTKVSTEQGGVPTEPESRTRIKISALRVASTLQMARDIAILALSGVNNSEEETAGMMLSLALETIEHQLAAMEGLEGERCEVALLVLRDRVNALRKFTDEFLSVDFLPLPNESLTAGEGGVS